MSAPELLPCPFCGQPAKFYEKIELKRACVGVCCTRCGNRTDVRDIAYEGHENSTIWWNRRIPAERLTGLLNECVKQLDMIIDRGEPTDFIQWRADLAKALSENGHG